MGLFYLKAYQKSVVIEADKEHKLTCLAMFPQISRPEVTSILVL